MRFALAVAALALASWTLGAVAASAASDPISLRGATSLGTWAKHEEEEEEKQDDKTAWAGLMDDTLRESANAIRISSGLPAMAASRPLSKAALSLAQDLVRRSSVRVGSIPVDDRRTDRSNTSVSHPPKPATGCSRLAPAGRDRRREGGAGPRQGVWLQRDRRDGTCVQAIASVDFMR